MKLVSDRDALATYRYLRIAMPVLIVLLTASVVSQVFAPEPDCWLGSISAYYYTSARAVFVASLCALGACLIIYHGNTPREDFVLNISGFLAFMVALVPTPLAELVVKPGDLGGPEKEPVCKRSNVPKPTQLTDAIDNNVLALLIAATLVLFVVLWFRAMSNPSDGASLALYVLVVMLVLSWIIFVVNRDFIRDHGHLLSAVIMFAGIVVVVFMNAIPLQHVDPRASAAPPPYLRLYRWILAAMVAATVVIGAIAFWGNFDHAVFWLEASLIGLFAAFWVVQTKELWNEESRPMKPER